MTEREKCEKGMLYDANYDQELLALRQACKALCHQLNQLSPTQETAGLVAKILGSVGKNCVITPPFWCDYGANIHIGDDFYANHNLVVLDGTTVTIGRHVMIGPNCCITTAGHPLDVAQRNQGLEFAHPIVIEDNVWIGANVTILPGVTIGANTVIGAGSVVTTSIPSGKIAFGSPCKVQRDCP